MIPGLAWPGPELNLTPVLNLAPDRDYLMQDQVSGKLSSQESPEASYWAWPEDLSSPDLTRALRDTERGETRIIGHPGDLSAGGRECCSLIASSRKESLLGAFFSKYRKFVMLFIWVIGNENQERTMIYSRKSKYISCMMLIKLSSVGKLSLLPFFHFPLYELGGQSLLWKFLLMITWEENKRCRAPYNRLAPAPRSSDSFVVRDLSETFRVYQNTGNMTTKIF